MPGAVDVGRRGRAGGVTLGIGLIGCGFNGRFHSTAIRAIVRRALLDVHYVAVCDEVEERARSFAEVTGARPMTDAAGLIESSDIDVVYVCVPTAYHKELVLRAANLGKHVFCEKPLATNVADVEEMVAAVGEAGVAAGVGLVLRHSPIMSVLKGMSDDPSNGRLMAIVFRDDQFFPITGHYLSDWRKNKDIVGAGTLLEHSIHDVDVLRWFGGEIHHVSGQVRNFAGHEGVEDLAVAMLEFDSGAVASLTSVWHSVLGRPSTRRLEMFFEKAYFGIDDDFLGPIHYEVQGSNPGILSADDVRDRYLKALGLKPDAMEGLLRYSLEDYLFLKAVGEGSPPYPDFRTALEAHRVVDAIYRSGDAGGARTAV
jgi:predicted dehydrogenase